jgi:hypothetical protein
MRVRRIGLHWQRFTFEICDFHLKFVLPFAAFAQSDGYFVTAAIPRSVRGSWLLEGRQKSSYVEASQCYCMRWVLYWHKGSVTVIAL